jgi:alpha-glucosidase (family GH31 glycosyl hydrolase)
MVLPRRVALALMITGALAASVLAGCTDDGDDAGSADGEGSAASSVSVGAELDDAGLLKVLTDTATLLSSATGDGPDGAFAWRRAEHTARPKGDVYLGHELLSTQSDEDAPWTAPTEVMVIESDGGRLATAELRAGDDVATLTAEPGPAGSVALTLTAPEGANEVAASFACRAGEAFRGFGAQTWATEHRGETIPIWVVEQGIAKVTPDDPGTALAGEPYDSYLPVPWFLSSAGYGVSLASTAYATFEMCTESHPDSWRLTTWDRTMSWHVLAGDTPRELVSAYTEVAGRALRTPPDWFYAPMNDAVRGQQNVERVAKLIRDNDIASSVIWTEDWIGLGSTSSGFRLSHDWDVSEPDYPELKAMTDDLHAAGYRFLGYFSPFIPDSANTSGGPATLPSGEQLELHPQNEPKWSEANEGEHWFRNPDGDPYLMATPPFTGLGAALDVTDDEAVEWFQGWVERAEALGLDGSMTDFGEWVPFDSQFADGRSGAAVHNEYPLLWQQANREVWERLRPDGDYLFYVRSGTTGTGRSAPAVWAGDQNTSFDRLDGLASVVTMGTNLGLSGIAYYGHDIAGYSGFPGLDQIPTTTKELFLRWAAIGAYTPMMRTHHGSLYGDNWSFEGAPNPGDRARPTPDPETLDAWKRLADEHISLFPYLKAYGDQAAATGLPIMRDPILVVPDDPVFAGELPDDEALRSFTDAALPEGELFQYFLGDELMVAPVIDEGATGRPVYLPRGGWVEIHSGERFEGPAVIAAEAAVGEIPVYARAGSLIPRLPSGVETLVPIDNPEVVDHTDVADTLVIDVFAGAAGRFELADGTVLELEGDGVGALEDIEADAGAVSIEESGSALPGGVPEASVPAAAEHEVVLTVATGTLTLRVTGGEESRGLTLRYFG